MLGGIGISAWYTATSDTVGERKEDRSAGRLAAVDGTEANVFRLSMINNLPVQTTSVSTLLRRTYTTLTLLCLSSLCNQCTHFLLSLLHTAFPRLDKNTNILWFLQSLE